MKREATTPHKQLETSGKFWQLVPPFSQSSAEGTRAAITRAVNLPRPKHAIQNKSEEHARNEKAKNNTNFLNIQKVPSTLPFSSQNYRLSF